MTNVAVAIAVVVAAVVRGDRDHAGCVPRHLFVTTRKNSRKTEKSSKNYGCCGNH